MFNNLEDKYLQKMLYFDAGINLYCCTADRYRNLFRFNDIENLSKKIIYGESHRFINVTDTNCVCAAKLVKTLAGICRTTVDIFIYCDDFSFDCMHNAIYITCCDIFLYCGKNTPGCDAVDLSRYYYLTDRRNETDTYYKNLARHFFCKRYELT